MAGGGAVPASHRDPKTMAAPEGTGELPLLGALLAYAAERPARFHMPAHQGGRGAPSPLVAALGPRAISLDVTGVEGLDDLHQPDGPIAAAERRAAALFGADRTFFLINGTTAGVQAMLLAAAGPGERVAVPRNAHKSIVAALILSGAEPVFLLPALDTDLGIPLGVPARQLAGALARGCRAALVVSPTYHGLCSDLSSLAALAHAAGAPLLVDEAHGAHFGFHPHLPPAALDQGADACAQGAHKVLGSLTQASLLHVRGSRLPPERVHEFLRVLQSTSASYLLLASLEAACWQMGRDGRERLARTLALAAEARDRLSRIPGLRVPGGDLADRPGVAAWDPTRILVLVDELGLTGRQAELWLRARHGVQAELSDLRSLLFLFTPGTAAADAERLVVALADLARHASALRDPIRQRLLREAAALPPLPPPPPAVATPREAFFAHRRRVPLEAARGRVSAEVVTCYPPGIPILWPGERVTEEALAYLSLLRRAGFHFSGPVDPSLESLQVLAGKAGGRR